MCVQVSGGDSTWLGLLPVFVFGLLLFVAGILGGVVYVLWRFRPSGPEPEVGRLMRAIVAGDVRDIEAARASPARLVFGFLFRCYQPVR